MKKGKHLVSLILAAAMAAGLTACGGQTAPQTTAAASEGTKQAEAAAPAESQEKEEASARSVRSPPKTKNSVLGCACNASFRY